MKNKQEEDIGCGCLIIFILFNIAIGGISVDYCLWYLFEKNVPWFADVIGGIFLGEFTVPLMVLCWLLKLCGIESPFL